MPDRRLEQYPRVGRRGWCLLLFAAVWLVVGIQVLTQDPSNFSAELLHHRIPLWLRVGLWWGPAAIAAIFAFRRDDTVAWALLIVAPIVRAVAYNWGTIAWWLTHGEEGSARSWAQGPSWLLVSALLLVIASWPEPPKRLAKIIGEAAEQDELDREEAERARGQN